MENFFKTSATVSNSQTEDVEKAYPPLARECIKCERRGRLNAEDTPDIEDDWEPTRVRAALKPCENYHCGKWYSRIYIERALQLSYD